MSKSDELLVHIAAVDATIADTLQVIGKRMNEILSAQRLELNGYSRRQLLILLRDTPIDRPKRKSQPDLVNILLHARLLRMRNEGKHGYDIFNQLIASRNELHENYEQALLREAYKARTGMVAPW